MNVLKKKICQKTPIQNPKVALSASIISPYSLWNHKKFSSDYGNIFKILFFGTSKCPLKGLVKKRPATEAEIVFTDFFLIKDIYCYVTFWHMLPFISLNNSAQLM